MQAFLLFNNQVSKLTSDLKLEGGVKTLLTTQAEAKIFELSLSRLLAYYANGGKVKLIICL